METSSAETKTISKQYESQIIEKNPSKDKLLYPKTLN